MQVFIARQPILDAAGHTFAYELLFRATPENRFVPMDGDVASAQIIHDSMLVFGLDELTQGGLAFVNITRQLLVDRAVGDLPADRVVLEILETVEPDAEVIDACRDLKAAGFSLALDDFVFTPAHEPLIDIADFIKVDFRAAPLEERLNLAARVEDRSVSLLAEKVETRQEVMSARQQGYQLFQGYYFARPEMMKAITLSGQIDTSISNHS